MTRFIYYYSKLDNSTVSIDKEFCSIQTTTPTTEPTTTTPLVETTPPL